jgi:hypothetical protein
VRTTARRAMPRWSSLGPLRLQMLARVLRVVQVLVQPREQVLLEAVRVGLSLIRPVTRR